MTSKTKKGKNNNKTAAAHFALSKTTSGNEANFFNDLSGQFSQKFNE